MKPEQASNPPLWGLKDIIAVFLISHGGPALLYLPIALYGIGNKEIHFLVFVWFSASAEILVPILWTRKRYKASLKCLGFQKGAWPAPIQVTVGILLGFLLVLFAGGLPHMNSRFVHNMTRIAFLSFSLAGFAFFILVPIGEEIFNRGLVYGYTKRRVGVVLGLVSQAAVFTMQHYIASRPDSMFSVLYLLFSGLVLGTLYQLSKSIYPSIICHLVYNYFIAVGRL